VGFELTRVSLRARRPRLSEMSWSCVMLCLHFSPGEIEIGVWARDELA